MRNGAELFAQLVACRDLSKFAKIIGHKYLKVISITSSSASKNAKIKGAKII